MYDGNVGDASAVEKKMRADSVVHRTVPIRHKNWGG